jgi:uracil phosphoribosyltransferase
VLTVVDHPLAQHLVTSLRDRTTPPAVFRALTRRLTVVLVLEAARDLDVDPLRIDTPLETHQGHRLAAELVAIPILRAGLGMLDAVTDTFPDVSVGYAVRAAASIRSRAPASLRMVCIVAAPEGVRAMKEDHPDVPVVSAALDRQLNDRGFILPGLGDFGDRLYGTEP